MEPLLSTQWFVKMKPLAEPAIRAVEDGRTRFVPENWAKTYFEWMTNIRDWCISRQLWWGHRIPAWYCSDCGTRSLSRARTRAAARIARHEPTQPGSRRARHVVQFRAVAVLDTRLARRDGGPARFYPTSLLITGFDILFFWVARMMMMGIEVHGRCSVPPGLHSPASSAMPRSRRCRRPRATSSIRSM